ncbi:MAG TPA: hypothetical protein VKU62_13695, partial [Thermoanaerobaculia bacterium]|nr:hypothetical protein [Thermoanaerobaculia bacterium]
LRRTNATLSLLLAAACLVAFAPAFTASVTNWDDDLYVRAPESQRISAGTFTHFVFGSFHPLTILSFAIEQQLFGRNAFLLHATNVVLHAASAALLFFLLRELGAFSFGAFAGALLWAIHPLRVESVVWIAERKDVLCTLFFVAALIAYGRRRLMLTFALFALALLSKGMAVTFPLAMLSIDCLQRRRALLEKIPFLAMSATFAAIGFAGQRPNAAMNGLPLVCQTFLFYIGKIFLPIRLNAVYLYPHRISWWSVPAAIAVVIIAFASRISGFAMLFFASTIAVVLPFVSWSDTLAADRFTYIPSIGIAVAIAFITKPKAWPLIAIIAAILGVLTFERSRVWHDSISLWNSVIAADPQIAQAYNGRAAALFSGGDVAGARRDIDRALVIDPCYAPALRNQIVLGGGQPARDKLAKCQK